MKQNENKIEMRMDEILSRLEQAPNDKGLALLAFDRVWRKTSKNSSYHFARKASFYFTRCAAVLFIPAVVSLSVILAKQIKSSDTEWVEMCIPAGEKKQIALNDGTILTLNSGSRITYPKSFNGNKREIFFDGEVLADVAKNKKKPFIIHVSDIDITVLGTKFDLKAYEGTSTVGLHLIEGNVKFGNSAATVSVAAGEYVKYNRDSKIIDKGKFDTTDWKSFTESTSLDFYKMTMKDIAKELGRIFGKDVIITDEELAQTKVLAWFSNGETLEDILDQLNMDGHMDIRNCNGSFYLSPR